MLSDTTWANIAEFIGLGALRRVAQTCDYLRWQAKRAFQRLLVQGF